MLTVMAMSLKGSIIAAGASKRKWGREDRESTVIIEGEGTSRIQMISRKKINQDQNKKGTTLELWKSFIMIPTQSKI